eukprot:scaffold1601_cov122-Skeletonema_dohrnii-CCMP3373.AAC.3
MHESSQTERSMCKAWGKGQSVKVKKCSSEECTNHAQKGGVCLRHGAKANAINAAGRDALIKPKRKRRSLYDIWGGLWGGHHTQTMQIEGCAHCFQFRMNSLRYDTLDLT